MIVGNDLMWLALQPSSFLWLAQLIAATFTDGSARSARLASSSYVGAKCWQWPHHSM